ncbi:MAG: YtxH domain-containing protein [Spirochaetia bacterium]|nr:YtxH domain-containing protein [Spirochaetia bacterium]
MSGQNVGEVILALLLGTAVGAGLGLFYATQPGKESRKRVKVFIDGVGEKTGELMEEGKETMEELVHPSKTAVKK